MPCIFCIAVFTLVAGALTAAHVDEVEDKLRQKAEGNTVARTVDSESVAKFELSVKVDKQSVPVAVTVYKDHKRVRIQVLTHSLGRAAAETLEDDLAAALAAEVVDRSDEESEAAARHALEHAAGTAVDAAADRVPVAGTPERARPQSSPKPGS